MRRYRKETHTAALTGRALAGEGAEDAFARGTGGAVGAGAGFGRGIGIGGHFWGKGWGRGLVGWLVGWLVSSVVSDWQWLVSSRDSGIP